MSRLSLIARCATSVPKNAPPAGWRGYSMTSEKPRLPDEDEFRVLNFTSRAERFQRKVTKRPPVAPPRAEQMRVDQNWGNVWPGARSFHPACVPLPVCQGWVPLGRAPPAAPANAELMKVPNFLHLTPPVVAAQCAAIKKFCTPWPEGLTDERCEDSFPLEVITSDYCHSGPSIRNPLSRIVSVRIKLAKFCLDDHARDKLRRIVGDHYDPDTDLLTIVTDRCPTRKQNLEYAMYLLTAIYHESWTVEDWEKEKLEEDMEVYIWERNASKAALVRYATFGSGAEVTKEAVDSFDAASVVGGAEYKEAISELLNEGENDYQMYKYAMAVKKLFGIGDERDNLVIDAKNKA